MPSNQRRTTGTGYRLRDEGGSAALTNLESYTTIIGTDGENGNVYVSSGCS
jgi:hypothetical protein